MQLQSNKSVGGEGTMCLTLILYNEGKTIAQVIEAFHQKGVPIYDYLVIGIDNKTDDNTLEEVKKYCSESNIFHFDFNDDFGGSRNKALKEVEKLDVDWVFMPDGHEVLKSKSLEIVKYFIDNSQDPRCNYDLISCFVEIDVDEDGIPAVAFPRPMFFRNKKGIFFERKVHNFIHTSHARRIISPEIRLIHNMPEGRKQKRADQRSSMNVEGLKKGADKGDIRDCFYLGNTYHEMGKFDDALIYFEKALERLVKEDSDYQMIAQICVTMAAIHGYKENWDIARAICFQSIKYRWDRAEAYYVLGYCTSKRAEKELDPKSRLYTGKMYEAAHWFKICTTMELPITPYFVQPKYYTWLPWDAIMTCMNRIGNLERAYEACNGILKYKKNNTDYLKNKMAIEHAIRLQVAGKQPQEQINKVTVETDLSGDPFS